MLFLPPPPQDCLSSVGRHLKEISKADISDGVSLYLFSSIVRESLSDSNTLIYEYSRITSEIIDFFRPVLFSFLLGLWAIYSLFLS